MDIKKALAEITKPLLSKPRFAIIFDTNILYSADGINLVHKDVESILVNYANLAEIKVFLPDIVFSERVQHIKEQAIEKTNRISEQIRSLNGMTSMDVKFTVPTEQEIENAVRNRFETWAGKHNVSVWNLTYEDLNLKEIVNLAIRKKSTFDGSIGLSGKSGHEKVTANEKGFKDFLIVKCIEEYLPGLDSDYEHILLISNDERVRNELQSLKSPKVEIFSKLEDVQERIGSILSNLSAQDVATLRAMFEKAFKENLLSTVSDEIKQQILNQKYGASPYLTAEYGPREISAEVSDLKFLKEEGNLYHWKTTLTAKIIWPPTPQVSPGYSGSFITVFGGSDNTSLYPDKYEATWSAKLLNDKVTVTDVSLETGPLKSSPVGLLNMTLPAYSFTTNYNPWEYLKNPGFYGSTPK